MSSMTSKLFDMGFTVDPNPLEDDEICEECMEEYGDRWELDEDGECPHCKREDEAARAEHEHDRRRDNAMMDAMRKLVK